MYGDEGTIDKNLIDQDFEFLKSYKILKINNIHTSGYVFYKRSKDDFFVSKNLEELDLIFLILMKI